jgi:CheY-like chemotaxis protein
MPKVLLAEDDSAVRNMLSISLERDGFEVVSVANVREALTRIRQRNLMFCSPTCTCRQRIHEVLQKPRDTRRLCTSRTCRRAPRSPREQVNAIYRPVFDQRSSPIRSILTADERFSEFSETYPPYPRTPPKIDISLTTLSNTYAAHPNLLSR